MKALYFPSSFFSGAFPGAEFFLGGFADFTLADFGAVAFAAVGLAIGTIGTAIASFVTGFINLTWWKMPLAAFGIMLLISGPSMILAWFKLRKRNLAPILDANGWAINAETIINISFGKTLTKLAVLPPNAKKFRKDPYSGKKVKLIYIVSFVFIVFVIKSQTIFFLI